MKPKLYLIILISILFSCKKNSNEENHELVKREFNIENFKNFKLVYSNSDYKLDLKTGSFKIDFYKFSDTIRLNEVEKSRIAQIFFENYIDTLKDYVVVVNEDEQIVMPDFGDFFTVSENNIQKSYIKISGQEFKKIKSLSNNDKNILKFKSELFKILNENTDFKSFMDTLKVAKENDKRLFL